MLPTNGQLSSLALRGVTPDDQDTITALAREIWVSVYSKMLPPGQVEYMLRTRYSRDVLLAEIADTAVKFVLLWLDGAPRGFATLNPTASGGQILLDKLYLHPSNHGQGHGLRALQLLESLAEAEMAGTKMCLRVNRYNSKAIRAYLRAGYAITDRICSDIGSGFVMDDYWMTKPFLDRKTE